MTTDIVIQLLEPEMASGIAALADQIYSPAVYPLTIVSCPGYATYVRRLLFVPSGERESIFVGALSRGELLGYAEWRPVHERGLLFLTGIAVDRAARAGGVGRRLHDAAIEFGRREGYERFELDVFDMNEKARAWYERLGFREMHRTLWTTGPTPAQLAGGAAPASPVCIREFAQAEASHEAHGFSSFRAATRRGEFVVGRIRDEFFRVTDARALEDEDLLRALGRLDPERRLLGVLPDATRPPRGFEVAACATRMEMPVP